MIYVVDSNISLKWVLKEPGTPRAVQLRNQYSSGIHELIAPDVFPIEVAHALARSERRGIIPIGDGAHKMADVFRSMPVLHPYFPLLPRAFAIASQFRIAVYDCLYVALAEREACELVTADDRLVKTPAPQFPFVVSLAAVP